MNKEQSIAEILSLCDNKVKSDLSNFFADKGWPPRCKKQFPTQYEHIRKHISRYNKKNKTDIELHDAFIALGADYGLTNHPSNKKLIAELEGIKSIDNLPKENPALYSKINDRAKEHGISIEEFLSNFNFTYTNRLSRQSLLKRFSKFADKEDAVTLDDLPDELSNRLKQLAKTDHTTKQNALLNLSKAKYHITGEQAVPVEDTQEYLDVVKKIMDNIFRANGTVTLTAALLRQHDLYDQIRYIRDALDMGTTHSIGDFIREKFEGYDYKGLDTVRTISKPNPQGLKTINVDLEEYTRPKK